MAGHRVAASPKLKANLVTSQHRGASTACAAALVEPPPKVFEAPSGEGKLKLGINGARSLMFPVTHVRL